MRINKKRALLAGSLTALLATAASVANEPRDYSPYAGDANPRNVYWGDTHLHTAPLRAPHCSI
ncbi:MAG: hypothetical protein AAGI11_22210 [Pseudomonadota bacterium]